MGQQQGQGNSGSTLRSCLSSTPSSPHGRQVGIWRGGMRIIRPQGTTTLRTRARQKQQGSQRQEVCSQVKQHNRAYMLLFFMMKSKFIYL